MPVIPQLPLDTAHLNVDLETARPVVGSAQLVASLIALLSCGTRRSRLSPRRGHMARSDRANENRSRLPYSSRRCEACARLGRVEFGGLLFARRAATFIILMGVAYMVNNDGDDERGGVARPVGAQTRSARAFYTRPGGTTPLNSPPAITGAVSIITRFLLVCIRGPASRLSRRAH